MSHFDEDPGESVTMSAADLAILIAEHDAALADVKRLREALTWATAVIQVKGFGSGKHFDKARAALAATGEPT